MVYSTVCDEAIWPDKNRSDDHVAPFERHHNRTMIASALKKQRQPPSITKKQQTTRRRNVSVADWPLYQSSVKR